MSALTAGLILIVVALVFNAVVIALDALLAHWRKQS